MEHLRPITEQQKRTNILLAELDRPTIPHMVANTMFEADPPASRALSSDDEDSDAGRDVRGGVFYFTVAVIYFTDAHLLTHTHQSSREALSVADEYTI